MLIFFFYFVDLDGLYLNEIDRILRPGGYWILSGPPIHWKKYWKGWERTKEDLNEEQTKIEKVATSLCWNKLIENGDIAIWQKPKNHFDCKANTQNRPFCMVQNNPDKAWYVIYFPIFLFFFIFFLNISHHRPQNYRLILFSFICKNNNFTL